MKKSFIIVTLVAIFLSCGNKKEEAPENGAKEESKEVKVVLTDFDRYEGKVVHSSTGQWYVIKNAARWRTNSIAATDDYIKSMPSGTDYVVENVPLETLKQFPEVGEILPKLEFKKDEIKTAK